MVWTRYRLKSCLMAIRNNRLRRRKWRKDPITRQIVDEEEGGDDAEFFMVQVKI